MTARLFLLPLLLVCLQPSRAADPPPAWKFTRTETLTGLKASLSAPVLVARSPGYCWFPTLVRLDDGELLALMSNYADVHTSSATAFVSWSGDGGLNWSDKRAALYGDAPLKLPGGDHLLLPYYLKPVKDGLAAPYQVIPRGKREARVVKDGVVVTGWPKPPGTFEAKLGLGGFVFNGQTLALKDGGFLATLYGYFKGEKRYSLVLVESKDGVAWKVRSVIAGADCKLPGAEGPCESAICRLKDGRVMCIFRLAGGAKFGQTFSKDDGKTWTEPAGMDAFSVQPSLAVLRDGTLCLSGGRPGIYLWVNRDGTGKDWQRIDLRAHHNASLPKEPIMKDDRSSSYTEVVAVSDTELLVIYDRIPHGWGAIPKDSAETNSVWVVCVRLDRP